MLRVSQLMWGLAVLVIACFGVSLSWSLLAVGVFCLALAGFGVGLGRLGQGRAVTVLDGLLLVVVAYFGWRAWQSPVWDLAKEDVLLMAAGLMTYWLFGSGRGSVLRRVTIVVLVVAVVANGVACLSQQSDGALAIPLDLVGGVSARSEPFGFFQYYGSFGNAMAVIGMVLCSFALAGRRAGARFRGFVGIIAGLALTLALCSGSRSAALSVVIASALLVVVLWLRTGGMEESLRKRARLAIFVVACCAGTLVSVFALKIFVERDGKVLQTGVATEQNIRESYWGMAVDQWMEAPLIGTGARTYSYQSYLFWDGALESGDARPDFAHNEYLQVLADYGLVGLVLLLVLLGWHWLRALKAVVRVDARAAGLRWTSLAGLLGLTVVMVHSFTDFSSRVPFNLFLAALCFAWCSGSSRKVEAESGEDKGGRIKERGLAVVMVLFSAGVAIFAGKEVWAATPLLLGKQAREDDGWEPEGRDDLLQSYVMANQRSPDFRRSQRVGLLYHLRYNNGEGAAFEKTEEAYKATLERHPYDPVSALNLASLYSSVGRFAEAERFYDRAEPYVAARDRSFNYFTQRAKLKLSQGREAYKQGQFDLADQLYAEAAELVGRGRSELKPRLSLRRDCYLERVLLALETGDYARAEELWLLTRQQVGAWILNQKEAKVYRVLGDAYFQSAMTAWQDREPELAKDLFEQANSFYKRDISIRKDESDAQRDERSEFATKALSILKQGGF